MSARYTAADAKADPFEPGFVTELEAHRAARAPKVEPIRQAELIEVANKAANRKVTLAEAASMQLTARHPHDAAGFMDVYKPGRWDCESDLVYMHVIVTGPSPGMWDGTVVYARFQPPSNGDYLVVGNFTGYQVTMGLRGPWGSNTAYCPTTSDHVPISAFWTSAAGEPYFSPRAARGPFSATSSRFRSSRCLRPESERQAARALTAEDNEVGPRSHPAQALPGQSGAFALGRVRR